MRCLQSAFAQGPTVRFGAVSVWMDLVTSSLELLLLAPSSRCHFFVAQLFEVRCPSVDTQSGGGRHFLRGAGPWKSPRLKHSPHAVSTSPIANFLVK
jgi:hypothetical protein